MSARHEYIPRRTERRFHQRPAANHRQSDGDPIYSHPRIALTPHVSWTGGVDVKRLADQTMVNLDAYAHGAPLADVFNRDLEY